MNIGATAMVLALVSGAADILGGCLTVINRKISRDSLLYLTALAAGFILSAAILDRIPETMEKNPHGALFILLGFLMIYVIENLFSIHAHPCADEEAEVNHGHCLVSQFQAGECMISGSASYTALVGLMVHTFFDGVAIAAGFITGPHTGILMFLAVIFHKLPEGFSMSSLMLAAGKGGKIALISAILLGLSTSIGAIFTLFSAHQDESLARMLLTLATGSFMYIGASDLIPATNRGRNKMSVLFVLLGVVLFYISLQILALAGFRI